MKLPVLFVSHGSPMQAVETTPASLAWQRVAQELPKPAAILMVSAHWESDIPLLTGSEQPETIHDFGGFPEALYRLRYSAPGVPALAQRIQSGLQAAGFTAGIEGCRGLDHGAWIPLLKMYPEADIPVLQLSVQPALGAAHHLALGQAIAGLRDDGVLIIGSGHMTHNLRDWFYPDRLGADAGYAVKFRDWIDQRIHSHDTDALQNWEQKAPYARRAHPSVEHFMPLFVALGAAGQGYQVDSLCAGYDNDVLAIDAYRFN